MTSNKNWFHRMLLSYLPIFFTVTFAIVFIFFFAAAEMSKKDAMKANRVFAEQVMKSVDYSLRSLNQYMIHEIMSNELMNDFISASSGKNPYIVANEMSQVLNDALISNPLISSIYIYRHSDRRVISPQSMVALEQFYDQEFIERHLQGTTETGWSSPRQVNLINEQPHNVVSLVRQMPILSGEQGIMVVNVKLASLLDLVTDMIGSDISYLQVIDKDGVPLFGTTNLKEWEKYEKSAITSLISPYTGWEIQSGIEDYGWLGITGFLSYAWIVIGLLVLLLGLGWMVWVTRQNYKPIQAIVRHIDDTQGLVAVPGSKKDEMSRIESALNQLISQSHEFQKQNQENMVYKKRHFFMELLEGSRPVSQEEWQEEVGAYGFPQHFVQLLTVVMEIDKYPDFIGSYSHRDQDLLRYVIRNVVHETAQLHDYIVWTEWLDGQQLGILFHLKSDSEHHEADVLALCSKLLAWIELNLNFTVTAAVGTPVDLVNEVYTSYEHTLEALKYKSVLGMNRVISYGDIKVRSAGKVNKQLQLMRSMAQNYRIGENEWKNQLDAIFADIKLELLPREDISGLLNYITYHMFRELMEMPEDIQNMWKNQMMPSLQVAIDRFETLDELQVTMFGLLEQFAKHVQTYRESRVTHSVIQDVRKYIELNYTNPDMSLSLICDQFRMKSSNLSRLFKEEFGQNFVDYLAQIRIEQAKLMLKESQEPIQDIAAKIGYSHYISFNRAFKKLTGLTPGDYRK